MDRLIIINCSPRAKKSNSLKYIKELNKYINKPVSIYNLINFNMEDLLKDITLNSEIIFVFPLYADGIPSLLISFFNSLKNYKFQNQKVHAVINCGFLEWQQNLVAKEILKLFCDSLNLNFCCSLLIGSGEAIMETPFKYLVKKQIKEFVKDIYNGKIKMRKVNMILTKKMFVQASTIYWLNYGKKKGINKEKMENEEIY